MGIGVNFPLVARPGSRREARSVRQMDQTETILENLV